MNIVITGGAGFLGARLARALLAQGELVHAGAAPRPILRLTLVDRIPAAQDLCADPRVTMVTGDLGDLLVPASGGCAAVPAGADLVFHLAAAVSGDCEADFDLGMRSNFMATYQLLEACRALGTRPTVVFASSLAVYGGTLMHPLPAVIDDHTLPTPQSSYGVQKFIGEQLMADYARKGYVRGRTVRLMTVSVRPGKPNGAASSFLSGIIREPLAGVRASCPVPPDTAVALSSPGRTIEGLIRAAQTDDSTWGAHTAVNLPALTTTPRKMVAALEQLAGPAVARLVDWVPDPAIARIVTSWPEAIDAARARGLGLHPDPAFSAIVIEYMNENTQAVRLS